MSERAVKHRLTDRHQIKQAVSILIAGGIRRRSIYAKIITLFHVDLDILSDVLYPVQK
jgi:hypothetical protein